MSRRRASRHAGGPLTWLSVVLLAYLVVPLLVFLARSAGSPAAGFSLPGLFPALVTSAEAATISACVVAFFGVPLAYWLARSHGRLASVAGIVVQLPLALPPLMSGVVLLYVFGNNTVLGRLSGGHLTESVTGIVLAQTFVASPFLVIAARSAFERVPLALEDVGATAGWGRLGRFWHIALPVAGPGIRAGLLLAWLRAFGEYGATVMMSYYPMSLPVFTYTQFSAVGLPATQAPAILSLALAAAVVALSRLRAPAALQRAVWRRHRPETTYASANGRAAPPSTGLDGPGNTGAVPVKAGRPGPAPVAVGFDLCGGTGTFRLDLRYQAATPRLAIVGPSGAGKSMTLRSLAGLLPGEVTFAGRSVGLVAPERRRVGYVPQGDSLLPHLRLWDNVTLGPHARPEMAHRWMSSLGLDALGDRLPSQLSGGQRQRGALARALSCDPAVLLLDEPFSGLDAPARASLVRELRGLQRSAGLSTVLVTHDITEAALLADEVVVISAGRLVQAGALAEVVRRPASAEVAAVIGLANLRRGRAHGPDHLRVTPGEGAPGVGALGGSTLVIEVPGHGVADGSAVTWSVPPRRLGVLAATAPGALPATVLDVADLGAYSLARLSLGPALELEAEVESGRWSPGGSCWLSLPPGEVLVWPDPLPMPEAARATGR